MKTEKTNKQTPSSLGLSIVIKSGPTGKVRDENWPCIEFELQLISKSGNLIWQGPFRLGVGHVKWPTRFEDYPDGASINQTHALNTIRMQPGAGLADKKLWASTAAFLAQRQLVFPKLEDVAHSLILDGSAYFDGEKFEDWADNFGYDKDSRKAESIYRECMETGRALQAALGKHDLESLREWASNY